MNEQVIIIGAGPCGLSAAVELKKRGIDPLIIEKGTLVNAVYNYPTYMIFHSTPERLEIGGVPFVTPNEKPTRLEALTYYRLVAERSGLRIHTYETVTSVERMNAEGLNSAGAADHALTGEQAGGLSFANVPHSPQTNFTVHTTDRFGKNHTYTSAHLIIATGYFDQPNKLGVSGEDLPKVSAYYKEAHPYAGLKVAIIGSSNSAVDSALDLMRTGAEVTVICRSEALSPRVKAWTRPLFESAAEKGDIRIMYNSVVREIHEQHIIVETKQPEDDAAGTLDPTDDVRKDTQPNEATHVLTELPNDFVLALIGYRPDRTLLASMDAQLDDETGAPVTNPDTMETNIPNLYVAGVIVSSRHANEIFIENGRFHGELIAKEIAAKLEAKPEATPT
ncbi:YpdA family putative bacillithiol disulfide reductase [Brevibacillus dissolubilis]|uniref:YpdA family putative bacillithiol disulfide reductase n=1 Tax=Brevibacillus dissolubilis TaxID=1844116 RepID=UPI001116748B|nr:YpdA family putative bacillithiol disulfide reductase [Brevibacillus dissolubilis]